MNHLSSYAGNEGDLGAASSYYGASSGWLSDEGAWLLPQLCYMYRLAVDNKRTPTVLQCWAVRKDGGGGSKTLINGIKTMNFIIV